MKSLLNKFKHALNGLFLVVKDKSVMLQFCFALLACSLAYVFKFTIVEWCILIFCCAFVIVSEMINTCIERMMDFIHPEKNGEVKKIKDMAAGFVLFAAIIALIIGFLLFKGKMI